jgi:tetratricopeptide (TPR) repeat protein
LAGPPEKLAAWRKGLSASAFGHPGVWVVIGQFAERDGKKESAARCYWHALELDPNHADATERLGRMLADLARPEAQTIAARAVALRELATIAEDVLRGSAPGATNDLRRFERAAVLCEQLGRVWEASAWASRALELAPQTAWAKEMLPRLLAQLDPAMPRTLDSVNPARTLNLSDYPLPKGVSPPSRSNASVATNQQ